MKKAIFLIISVLLFSCNRRNVFKIKKIELPQNGTEIVNAANKAGFEVFSKLADSSEESNIMFSPLSLNIPLTIVYNGANGNTKTEIGDFLAIGDYSLSDINNTYETIIEELIKVDSKTKMSIANSLWVNQNYSIKSDFKKTVSSKYFATVDNLDFSSPKSLNTINDWVSDNTHGKIKKILDNLSPSEFLVLVNALYFQSKWHYKFPKANTENLRFYLADSSYINVPTMQSESNNYKMATVNNCVIVELPYSQGNFVMDLIKPDYGANFENCIDVLNDWQNVVSNLTNAQVQVSLPKFEFKKTYDLIPLLKEKFPDAFGSSADFSNLSEYATYISKVIQKTYVKTDEDGTTAAAATGIGMGLTSDMETLINYDVPFIFIIREVTTGSVMFVGKVSDPRDME